MRRDGPRKTQLYEAAPCKNAGELPQILVTLLEVSAFRLPG